MTHKLDHFHNGVIKWKHLPLYWFFVRGIHRSPVNSPYTSQWRGALMFSLIYAWINGWVNDRETGDLRRHRVHYDVNAVFVPTVISRLLKSAEQIIYFLKFKQISMHKKKGHSNKGRHDDVPRCMSIIDITIFTCIILDENACIFIKMALFSMFLWAFFKWKCHGNIGFCVVTGSSLVLNLM